LFFHTIRSVAGPYRVFSAASVTSTFLQYGHSKSPSSTIVTGALRLPHEGSAPEIGIDPSSVADAAIAVAASSARTR